MSRIAGVKAGRVSSPRATGGGALRCPDKRSGSTDDSNSDDPLPGHRREPVLHPDRGRGDINVLTNSVTEKSGGTSRPPLGIVLT